MTENFREEANKWIGFAKRNLDSARFALSHKRFDEASFWAQQSAEKALKAVWIGKGFGLQKTHNLVILGKKIGLSEEFIEELEILSSIYLVVRYPLDIDVEKELVAETSRTHVKTAEKVLEWTEKNL